MPHVLSAHSGATAEGLAPCHGRPWVPTVMLPLLPAPLHGRSRDSGKDSRTANRFWHWADRVHEVPEQCGTQGTIVPACRSVRRYSSSP